MSNDEFAKNEQQIMEQLKNGQIKEQKPDYSKYTNPLTGSKKAKNELPQKSSGGNPGEGKWVTINGNHVLIEK